jgi:hypothetical protein
LLPIVLIIYSHLTFGQNFGGSLGLKYVSAAKFKVGATLVFISVEKSYIRNDKVSMSNSDIRKVK